MDIFTRLRIVWQRYRQKQAERQALQVLIARRDRQLLRDVGLHLIEGDHPRCEPLPQTKERRWAAPLIRLPSPPSRTPDAMDGMAVASSDRPAA